MIMINGKILKPILYLLIIIQQKKLIYIMHFKMISKIKKKLKDFLMIYSKVQIFFHIMKLYLWWKLLIWIKMLNKLK